MNRFGKICAVAALAGASTNAMSADVVIGVPNWPSVNVTANVLKVVIEDNFGLEVELQNGTNPVVFEAMDSGSMHVHPEVWLPNQSNLHDKFVKTKGTVKMNPNGVSAFQGMCVTKHTAEEYDVTKISDLTDPDIAKIFDTDGDGQQVDHPEVQAALERILGAARSAGIGVCPGIPIGVAEQAWWVERGRRRRRHRPLLRGHVDVVAHTAIQSIRPRLASR